MVSRTPGSMKISASSTNGNMGTPLKITPRILAIAFITTFVSSERTWNRFAVSIAPAIPPMVPIATFTRPAVAVPPAVFNPATVKHFPMIFAARLPVFDARAASLFGVIFLRTPHNFSMTPSSFDFADPINSCNC